MYIQIKKYTKRRTQIVLRHQQNLILKISSPRIYS